MLNQQNSDYDADDGSDLLLVKLTPEAISRTWPDLRAALEVVLPPISNPTQGPDRMTNILEALLTERLICYCIYKRIDGTVYVFGIVIVSIMKNVESEQRNLLIYALYAHPKYVSGDYAEKFILKMKEVAKNYDCKALVAYTSIPNLISHFVRLGGDASYRLLTMEVDNG